MGFGTTRRTTRTATRRTQRVGGKGRGGATATAGIVAIVFLGIVFVAVLGWQKYQAKLEQDRLLAEANRKIQVVAAARTLPKDAKIRYSDLTLKEIPAKSQLYGTFEAGKQEALVGKYTVTSIREGQVVMENLLTDEAPPAPVRKLDLLPDEVEVKTDLSMLDASAYFMKAGNNVSVYSVLSTPSGNRITRTISKAARVLLIEEPAKDNQLGYAYVALTPAEARQLNRELIDHKTIRYQEEGLEAPPSTASIVQNWIGIEMEERELSESIGSTLVVTGDDDF